MAKWWIKNKMYLVPDEVRKQLERLQYENEKLKGLLRAVKINLMGEESENLKELKSLVDKALEKEKLSELWVCTDCKWYGTSEEQEARGSKKGCCPICGDEDLLRLDSIVEVFRVCGNDDEIDHLIKEIKDIKTLLSQSVETLDWMIKDMDYRNRQNNQVEDSPELIKAKKLLKELRKL